MIVEDRAAAEMVVITIEKEQRGRVDAVEMITDINEEEM